MKKSSAQKVESPAQLIDARIKELGDWRGKTLSRLRALIKQADPEVVEEWKWRKPSHPGVPVWFHQGPICTGETYKSVVKTHVLSGPGTCGAASSRRARNASASPAARPRRLTRRAVAAAAARLRAR